MQEEYPDDTHWRKVVEIFQETFRDKTLADESTWQTVVLIPKVCIRDFRGGGIMEVLWKIVTSLLNRCST